MTSEKAVSVEQRLNALIALGVDSTQTDTSTTTLTSASDNPVSAVFTIPADSQPLGPAVGTLYELVIFGSATWGSTAQALTFNPQLGGTTAGGIVPIGAGQFNASAGIRWRLSFMALCTATGAGGAFAVSCEGSASLASGNLLSGQGANGTIALANGSTPNQSIDTTASFTMKITGNWASATGSPSLTCRGTVFRRSGP